MSKTRSEAIVTDTVAFNSARLANMQEHGISVIMPAYNLQDSILSSIKGVQNVLKEISEDYEVVIVDDGSSDATFAIASSLSDDRVKVVRNTVNQGKGYSVRRGVEATIGQYVIMLDADRDLNISKLKRYVSLLDDNDLILASKRHPESIYSAPLSRKVLSLAFNALVRLLTGVNRSDTQTGMKAFRGDAFKKVIKLVLVKRYAFDVEILSVANLLNLKIAEVPVTVKQGRSIGLRSVMYMLVDLLGIAYRLRIERWYQKSLAAIDPQYEPLLKL